MARPFVSCAEASPRVPILSVCALSKRWLAPGPFERVSDGLSSTPKVDTMLTSCIRFIRYNYFTYIFFDIFRYLFASFTKLISLSIYCNLHRHVIVSCNVLPEDVHHILDKFDNHMCPSF